MSNVAVREKNMLAVESALVRNDISQLSVDERMAFVNKMCESLGLNPLTKPFAFLKLNGKEVIYATKDCSEQLRKIHGVSTQIISKGIVGDLFEVHVKARDKHGKEDDDVSYVVIKGMIGADLANAMMKGITKAKRRVTLSICGLGLLDESELDTIDNISPASNPQIQNQFKNVSPAPETEALPPVIDQSDKIDPVDESTTENSSDYVIKFGKKYKDQKIKDVATDDHKEMISWLEKEQEKGNYKIKSADEYLFHAKNYVNRSVDENENAF